MGLANEAIDYSHGFLVVTLSSGLTSAIPQVRSYSQNINN